MNHETGKFYTLAGTAVRAWQILQDGICLEDVVATLSQEYEVEPQKCLEDIQSMLTDLEQGGLIEIVSNKPS
jgi:hypothetical protein